MDVYTTFGCHSPPQKFLAGSMGRLPDLARFARTVNKQNASFDVAHNYVVAISENFSV